MSETVFYLLFMGIPSLVVAFALGDLHGYGQGYMAALKKIFERDGR